MNVRPWEWELMTVEETDGILDWLDAYEQAQRKAQNS